MRNFSHLLLVAFVVLNFGCKSRSARSTSKDIVIEPDKMGVKGSFERGYWVEGTILEVGLPSKRVGIDQRLIAEYVLRLDDRSGRTVRIRCDLNKEIKYDNDGTVEYGANPEFLRVFKFNDKQIKNCSDERLVGLKVHADVGFIIQDPVILGASKMWQIGIKESDNDAPPLFIPN